MFYIFLSICCSVIVSILLKLARRYQIDVFQAITWNYSIAILLTWFFLKPQFQDLKAAPFYIYSLLGLLLPSIFVVIAASIRYTGIVRTEIAERLSLFIPIIAAFLLFDEKPTILKLVGVGLGFAAILCSVPWQRERYKTQRTPGNAWLYLFVVFVGMGVIDILFKQMALANGVSFGTSLFMVYVISFVLGLLGLVYLITSKKTKFSWPHILFGWILGVANFGNILFYLKAHQSFANKPSVVFSATDIGVIVLGSIVGLMVFKERLTAINKVGIALAIIAIIVIYYPQLF